MSIASICSPIPQVLLKNMSTVSIPAVMDPLAFESVLSCAYTGQLRMLREDIVNYLTVGSVLQMWHIVDKCTELLKEGRAAGSRALLGQAGGGKALGTLAVAAVLLVVVEEGYQKSSVEAQTPNQSLHRPVGPP